MELNVCWMYHDIMDLYGDKGNMMVLQKRCEERGISITIDTLSIGDQRDLRSIDLRRLSAVWTILYQCR